MPTNTQLDIQCSLCVLEVGPSHPGSDQFRRVESQDEHRKQSGSVAHRSMCTLTQHVNMNIIILNTRGSVVEGSLACKHGFNDAFIQSWDRPSVYVEDANLK